MADIAYVASGYAEPGYVVRFVAAEATTLTVTSTATALGGRLIDPTLSNRYTWDDQAAWDTWSGDIWDSPRRVGLSITATVTSEGIVRPPVFGTANLTTEATAVATATRIKSALAAITSAGSFALSAQVIPPVRGQAAITSVAQVQIQGNYLQQATAATAATATMTASADRTRSIVLTLDCQATISIEPKQAVFGSADLVSAGFATITVNPIWGGATTLSATTTLTCTPGRIRDAGLDTSTISWDHQTEGWDSWLGTTWESTLIGIRLIALDSILALGTTGQSANLQSEFTVQAQAGYIKGLVASVTSSATLAATGDRLIRSTATMLAQAQVAALATRIHPGVATISTAAAVAAASERVRGSTTPCNAVFTVAASGAKVVLGSAAVASLAGLAGLGGRLRLSTAALQALAFELTVADVIAIDTDFFVRIDPESGIIQVLADHRMLTVHEETGLNMVLPETRALVVPQETRQETVL